jgi:curved DNA-binding protein
VEYKDYYKILGLERNASAAEIKKAYRKLARAHHPDRNPGDAAAEGRFKEANEANEVLSDPGKRAQYDALGANWDQFTPPPPRSRPQPAGQRAPGGGVRYEFRGGEGEDLSEFSDFFRMFFGQDVVSGTRDGTARPRTANPFSGAGSPGEPFADLFAQGGSPRPAPRQEDLDVSVEVELSLEEAYGGSARLLVIGEQRLEVKIPAGVDTGSKIRLRGKAGTGPAAGDIYLVAKVRPHPVFARTGADLSRELPITLAEALLGAQVEVDTLRGRVLLKIPAGTQGGQVFKLTGQGMPRLGNKGIGDLLARVKVVLPTRLEGATMTAAKELLAQIAQPNPRRRT